jgi:polyisoprenoid-binding protein YceI
MVSPATINDIGSHPGVPRTERVIMTDTSTATTRTVNGTELPLPGTYAIDASHTHVGFTVRHMMVSKVRGQFDKFDGTVVIAEDPTQSSVNVTVEVDSINTNDENRDGHLKSADFFNTEANKHLTFVSTAVRPDGSKWDVDGDATLNGVTKQITLVVDFEGALIDPYNNLRIGFSATGEINREDFGLSWNAALETGGVVVGKQVKLEIEAEAVIPQG